MRLLVASLCAVAAGCGTGRPHGVGPGGDSADLSMPGSAGCSGGLHCQIAACDTGVDTVLTGHVYAPNGLDPVPNATVYVPDQGLPEFPTGVSCDLCNAVSEPAALTTTSFDGSFTLTHVPSGDDIPLVVQLGHFRRVVHLHVDACTTAEVPHDPLAAGLRLAKSDGELDPQDVVPRIAVATGDYDQIECVLHRMGIERFDLYDDRGGLNIPPTIAPLQALFTDGAKLLGYNIVVVNCTQNEFQSLVASKAVQANLANFVTMGGRLYVTDWAYDVIEQVPEFAPYLCFEPQDGSALQCRMTPDAPEIADTTNSYSTNATIVDPGLAQWLRQFPNVIQNGAVPVDYSFVSIASVAADTKSWPTTTWVEGQTPFGVRPLTVTFDYDMCGRVHYSTYNTEPNGVVPDQQRYPNCRPDFSPQERILEYLVFEIANCVGPPPG
jgi:hypothetical protein